MKNHVLYVLLCILNKNNRKYGGMLIVFCKDLITIVIHHLNLGGYGTLIG